MQICTIINLMMREGVQIDGSESRPQGWHAVWRTCAVGPGILSTVHVYGRNAIWFSGYTVIHRFATLSPPSVSLPQIAIITISCRLFLLPSPLSSKPGRSLSLTPRRRFRNPRHSDFEAVHCCSLCDSNNIRYFLLFHGVPYCQVLQRSYIFAFPVFWFVYPFHRNWKIDHFFCECLCVWLDRKWRKTNGQSCNIFSSATKPIR